MFESEMVDERVKEYNRLFDRFYQGRTKWYNRGIENEELVYSDREGTGTQLKSTQLKTAQDNKAIPITVNILAAVKEQIQAFLTAFKPSMTCVPIGRSSKSYSYVWKEVCSALWYLNNVSRELDAVISDSLTVGNGYLRVRPSNFFTSNDFNVIIEYVPWQYVYLDPNSKRQDLKDHEAIILAIPYTSNKAKKIYNLTEDEVNLAKAGLGDGVSIPTSDNIETLGTDDKQIWLQEIFKKEKHTIYVLEDGRRVFEKPTEEKSYVDQSGKLVSDKVISQYQDVFIRHVLKVGNFIKSSTLLPCTEYPIVKFGCKWNKKPYDYPVVHDIVDLQKAFNTFLAITILNAQIASNAGYIAPEGSVDKAQFAKDRATPGGVAEYDADAQLPNGGAPTQVIPLPLSSAWYTLMTQIIHFIEYVTGIYGVIQGNPQNAPVTLGATNSLQDLGTQRVKRNARHIDFSLNDLFNVVIQYTQAYSRTDAVVSYINNTDAIIQIQTNVQGRLEQDKSFQQDTNGQDKAALVENMVTGEVKAILGDIKAGQYHVRFQNASDLPSTRTAALSIIKELMAHMSSPEIAVALADQALDLLDMPHTDMILEKVEIIKQMQGKIQQLTERVQTLAKDNQKLTEEVFDREKDIKLLEFDKDLNKTRVKIESLTKEQEDTKKELEKKQEQKQSIYS